MRRGPRAPNLLKHYEKSQRDERHAHRGNPTSMRTLSFAPKDRERRFIICYTALCGAPAKLDDRMELRYHGALLSKLEHIAIEVNPDRSENEGASFACPDGGVITLTEPEYQILKRFLNAAIHIPQLRSLSRELDHTIDWLDNVAETKPVAKMEAKIEEGEPIRA